jgi:hypothetical protein
MGMVGVYRSTGTVVNRNYLEFSWEKVMLGVHFGHSKNGGAFPDKPFADISTIIQQNR